mmetsp:Transcript_4004/g.9513  ORF Transcript_4004/g.9513 Transcript_4004/m.9513 type:complete len:85 (+) Transcript_4004:55-309(+)
MFEALRSTNVVSFGVPGSLTMDGFQTSCQLQGHSGAEATYRGCPAWYRSGLFPEAKAVDQGLMEGMPAPIVHVPSPAAKAAKKQ